jgi:hypothetical protein
MREQIGEQYLYLSPRLAESQILAREKMLIHGVEQSALSVRLTEEQAGEHLKTLLSVFDEKQRRLFLGFESLRFGHGGDVRIALVVPVSM